MKCPIGYSLLLVLSHYTRAGDHNYIGGLDDFLMVRCPELQPHIVNLFKVPDWVEGVIDWSWSTSYDSDKELNVVIIQGKEFGAIAYPRIPTLEITLPVKGDYTDVIWKLIVERLQVHYPQKVLPDPTPTTN